MKILIVGSGGREHALADALSRENTPVELIVAPGNPGIAQLARLSAVPVTDVERMSALAVEEQVQLVVVGPEAPLAAGMADRMRQLGLPVFGPSAEAATVETSKAGTKALMLAAGVPTALAEIHKNAASAKEAVRLRFGAPVVIKASGLAAGKGVIVCQSLKDADAAIDRILGEKVFGDAGNECLVEAFMTGEELSLFAITDGVHVQCMIPAQDHKRLGEGDVGPNTGGMGAYAPVALGTPALIDDATERVFLPTLHALRKRGTPFTGLLYAGLMLTPEGPKVVEFNCRFGDPETQAILPLLESSLLDSMLTVARGASVRPLSPLHWSARASVTTVVAAAGYPDSPRGGDEVRLPDDGRDLRVYHAGTARRNDGGLITSGGRVVSVTGMATTFAEAQEMSRTGAAAVHFEGAQFRRDIGWRETERERARDKAHALASALVQHAARESAEGSARTGA